MKTPSSLARLWLMGAGMALLGGCATTAPTSPADPFEPWNRAMYEVHQVVDGNFVKPAVQAYVDYTPKPIQQTIRNFFGNIDDFFSFDDPGERGGRCAAFSGTARVKDGNGSWVQEQFGAIACDNGEPGSSPGRGPDRYGILLEDGRDTGETDLTGGNIQAH